MKRSDDYDQRNAEAARLFLNDPPHYGPGMVAWAQAWTARHGQHAEQRAEQQGSDGRGQLALEFRERANGVGAKCFIPGGL